MGSSPEAWGSQPWSWWFFNIKTDNPSLRLRSFNREVANWGFIFSTTRWCRTTFGVFCLFGEVFGVESQQSTTKRINGPCNGYSNITSTSPNIPSFFGVCYVGNNSKNMKVVEGTIVGQQICSPPIDHLRAFSGCIFLRSGQYGMDPFCGTVGFRWWNRCFFRVVWFWSGKISVIFKTCCMYM